MDIALCAVYGSAIISVWELVAHLPEELEYIWVTPQFRNDKTVKIRNFSPMKALYIYSRYFIFITLYQFFITEVQSSRRSKPLEEGWILYRSSIFQMFVWCIDLPQMKIVYLLFGGMRKTLYLLVALGLAKLCMDLAIIWTYHLERVEGYRMGPNGLAPISVVSIFTWGEVSLHSILAFLAFLGQRRAKHAPTPASRRLTTFHWATPFMVTGLMLFLVGAHYMEAKSVSQSLYPLLAAAFSALGCRSILIMHSSYYRKKRTIFDPLSSDSDDNLDNVAKEEKSLDLSSQ
ncbi:hypothetical protein HYPSUDRAFT_61822 [Hypholoma sublateritium FD-334 SS-4]|uniref:Uncharacterized protein n=1 Tax=Hypholoma sublateritium (strain FD-334 SS-4) TaxID=945553 RepID=A0A0D2MY07_HYPSF|nr:hypothetical protein HYPSUDRAFT_61822 [Hypholoma sublateritium FD-334 SS-4]